MVVVEGNLRTRFLRADECVWIPVGPKVVRIPQEIAFAIGECVRERSGLVVTEQTDQGYRELALARLGPETIYVHRDWCWWWLSWQNYRTILCYLQMETDGVITIHGLGPNCRGVFLGRGLYSSASRYGVFDLADPTSLDGIASFAVGEWRRDIARFVMGWCVAVSMFGIGFWVAWRIMFA